MLFYKKEQFSKIRNAVSINCTDKKTHFPILDFFRSVFGLITGRKSVPGFSIIAQQQLLIK
jgi:hypothetical protein